ncbi:MAG TPA: sensor domain-containing protein [Mycobacteriales bacterium]|nr:sensor domain-containing protein [Mycobacteriales bacterium]
MARLGHRITRRLTLVGWASAMTGLAVVGITVASLTLTALGLATVWVGLPLFVGSVWWLRGLADMHRAWAAEVMGIPVARPYRTVPDAGWLARFTAVVRDPATWRDLVWVAVDGTAGVALCVSVMATLLAGVGGLLLPAIWTQLPPHATIRISGIPVTDLPSAAYVGVPAGVLYLAVWWWATPWLMRGYAGLTRWMLAPAERTRLADRVDQLAATRADTVDAQAAELRRIERDLHDGAQARLVALGMNVGMARDLLVKDPPMAAMLLDEAAESTGLALAELRDLVRGIHPPVLSDRGLDGAVRALALASPLPVRVDSVLPGRPRPPVEAAGYFAVAEALANMAKHSGATSGWVRIRHADGCLRLVVGDHGRGGAVITPGAGLHGIARRLAAFDGTLVVTSPPGGPTTVSMELPCELS